jgi:hypothetical protein
MRNLILSALLLASVLQLALGQQVYTSGDWLYTVENNEATITGYTGVGGEVTAPSEFNGIPVIGVWGSSYPAPLSTTITIMNLPNSVRFVRPLGSGFTAITSFHVDINNPYLSVLDGVLYDKNKATLFHCDRSRLGNFSIPNSVTRIAEQAFAGCAGLTSVQIPNSITAIEWGAFAECGSLTEVTIPGSVQEMFSFIFYKCSNLTKATFYYGVTMLASNTFADCTSLVSVNLPEGLRYLGGLGTFNGCTSLTSIVIPSSVTFAGASTFARCSNLTKVLFLGDAPTAASSVFALTTATVFYLCGTTGWGSTFCERPTQIITAKDIIQTPDIVGLFSNGQYSSQYSAGQQSVISSPNSYSLYTTSQIQNMAFGDLVLTKNANGSFTLNYDIEQSNDLQNWSTYAPLSTPLAGLPADKAFVRIKAKQ